MQQSCVLNHHRNVRMDVKMELSIKIPGSRTGMQILRAVAKSFEELLE